MTDAWRRVDQMLHAALLRPPAERDGFLRQECAGDTALEKEVRSLLAADEQAGSFLDDPAIHAAARALADDQRAGEAHRTGPLQTARMALSPGSRLGAYEISSQIGAGGMGEVYRAIDSNLGRQVAIKVLPESVAADPDRLTRFDREARTLAALNHSNIAAIYGLERSGGTIALVMELVEGLTLADRIMHGAIPVEEALPVAKQIAEALEAAHERGIVHRDLKPANIKLRSDGTVKVLDFGLAKAVGPAAGSLHGVSQGATKSTPAMTEAGIIVGTAAYMSPEQASGKAVDHRADIWAFGCVLFEMLTGHGAFSAETLTDTLAAVMRAEPEWSRVPSGVPDALRELMRRCLRKDPQRRLQAIGDARIALDEILSGASDANLPAIPSVAGGGRKHALPWALACAATVAALVLLAVLVATVNAPTPASGPLVLKQLTFSTDHKNGPIVTDGTRLYFKNENGPVEMSVNGGPTAPLRASIAGMKMIDISPDGSELLALKEDSNDTTHRGSLWLVPVIGGGPRRLGNLMARGAQWSRDGRSMVYADVKSVYVGNADGRNIRKIWDAPGEVYTPVFSPDSRRIRVTVSENAGESKGKIWELNLDGSSPHRLDLDWPEDANQFDGQWAPDGEHFIFRSSRSGQVNIDDLYEVVSPPWFAFWKKPTVVRLTQGQINVVSATPSRVDAGLFVVGQVPQGVMHAYDPAQKRMVPFLGGLAAAEFVISPDKKWMVYVDYPQHHLWRSRLDGSERSQLTDIYSVMPRWSPDSTKIAFSDWDNIYMVSADGGIPEKLIGKPNQEVWPAWSPDGKSIAFNDYPVKGHVIGIKVLDLATRKISMMPGSEGLYMPTWSPDGKYMIATGQDPLRRMLYSAQAGKWTTLRRSSDTIGNRVWSNDSQFLYIMRADGIYRLAVADGAWSQIASFDRLTVLGNPAQGAFPSVTSDGQPAVMINTSIDQIYSAKWN